MYETRLAYRHINGDIEGFIGAGFTKPSSRSNCLNYIVKKLDMIEQKFSASRVVHDLDKITKEELEIVRRDWKLKG